MDIPYTVEPRNDTGLYNGKLGIWLFLASEAMLFGGLFSAYVFLRAGATEWPSGPDVLNVPLATVNTAILIGSSLTIAMAWASLKLNDVRIARAYLAVTVLLGVIFLAVKMTEYGEKFGHGLYPSTNNFYAIYFILTGVHFLHIVGGLVVILYLAGPGSRMWAHSPEQYVNRIEVTGLYWHFVDLVWLLLFPTLYLI